MKSHSDINLIRHYCNIKHIEIFDASYHYQKEFSHLSESVFRKYMSRLVEEGFLQYVAKGIYYVGWKMPDDIDKKIEQYFLSDGHNKGIFGGKALLYKLGIIDEKPETIEILSPVVTKNRNIRNYYVKPLNSRVDDTNTIELLELLSISIKNDLDEDSQEQLIMAIGERLLKYKGLTNSPMVGVYKIDYPRVVYSKLAILLEPLHKSNEVKQWYENQIEISDKKG